MKHFPLLLILVTISLLVIIPIWKGYKIADENYVFSGVTGLYTQETFYYLALGPAQMVKGKLLGQDKFGRAPEKDLFLNPIGNIIAAFSNLFNINTRDAFTLFRLLAVIFLCLSFYLLSGIFIKDPFYRAFSLFLYITSAGVGSWWKWGGIYSWANTAPEMNIFISIIGEYYLPISNGLLILFIACCIRLFYFNMRGPYEYLTGIILLILGAVYVYGMLIAVLISSVIALICCFHKKISITGAIKYLLIFFLFTTPVIIYYVWLFSILDLSARTEGWFLGPGLSEVVLTFFWTILPAFIFLFLKGKAVLKDISLLLTGWAITIILLTRLHPPLIPFQIQAFIGLGAPLAILSTLLFQSVVTSWRNKIYKTLVISSFILVSCNTNFLFYKDLLDKINQKHFPEFISSGDWQSMQWINKNIPMQARFLVSPKKARVLTGLTACNVIYSIGPEGIVTSEMKIMKNIGSAAEMEQDSIIQTIMTNERVTHIFLDKDLTDEYFGKEGADYLKKEYPTLYKSDAVTILLVRE